MDIQINRDAITEATKEATDKYIKDITALYESSIEFGYKQELYPLQTITARPPMPEAFRVPIGTSRGGYEECIYLSLSPGDYGVIQNFELRGENINNNYSFNNDLNDIVLLVDESQIISVTDFNNEPIDNNLTLQELSIYDDGGEFIKKFLLPTVEIDKKIYPLELNEFCVAAYVSCCVYIVDDKGLLNTLIKEDPIARFRASTHLMDYSRANTRAAESETLYKGLNSGGEITLKSGNTKINISNSDTLDLTKFGTSTSKILCMLLEYMPPEAHYAHKNNSNIDVKIPLNDIAERLNRKPGRRLYTDLKKQLNILYESSIELKTKNIYEKIGFGANYGVNAEQGIAHFEFNNKFFRLLTGNKSFYAGFDKRAYSLDQNKYPQAWFIYVAFANKANSDLKTEVSLHIQTLLKDVPNIPTEDEIQQRGTRSETRDIITVLEKNLNELINIGVLNWWDYCHSSGRPLTDREQQERLNKYGNEKPLPWYIAKNCYIRVELTEAPYTQKDFEERTKQKQRRKELKEQTKHQEKEFNRYKNKHKARREGELEAEAEAKAKQDRQEN